MLAVRRGVLAFAFPQHPDEHRPQRPILLAVDQELGEGASLRVSPELTDPVGALEVGRSTRLVARRCSESQHLFDGNPAAHDD